MVGEEMMRHGERAMVRVRQGVVCAAVVAVALLCAVTASARAAVPGTIGVGDFSLARGIAVDQETGDVYVSDAGNQSAAGNNRVVELSGEGRYLRAWGWGVVNGAGELQVCTEASNCREGLQGAGVGQLNHPEAIAVDNTAGLLSDFSHGDVYLADTDNDRVEKFGAEGQYLASFGSEGSADGQFEAPRAIAVDPEGHVYVGDQTRVQRFSEAGVFEATVVSGVGSIEGLAAAPNGDIYVISNGQAGVHEFEPDGKEVVPVRDQAGNPRVGLAVDGAGDLFVNDQEGGVHRLFEYDSAGTQVESFDKTSYLEGAEPGMAWNEDTQALYLLVNDSVTETSEVRVVGPPAAGPLILQASVTARLLPHRVARIEAEVDPEGAETEYFVEYGTTSALNQSTAVQKLPAGFTEPGVSVELAGLEFSTEYHYCLVAVNANGRTPCVQKTFTELPASSIDSQSVSDVSAASATFIAEINPEEAPTTCHCDYGSQAHYAATGAFEHSVAASAILAPGTEDVSVSAHVGESAGLVPGTEYAYQFSCEKEGTVDVGGVQSFRTQSEHTGVSLPDQRSLERVAASAGGAEIVPPQKEGFPQIAEDGSGIVYRRFAPGVVSAEGNFYTVELARHGSGGWVSADIGTPYTSAPGATAGKGTEFRLFSGDLSASIMEPWDTNPLAAGVSERTPYRRTEVAGKPVFEPLLTSADVSTGAAFGAGETVSVEGATPDMTHVALESLVPLTSSGVSGSLYEWAGGALTDVSVLPGSETVVSGLLGSLVEGYPTHPDARGAISADGSLVYWSPQASAGINGLYVRDTQTGESLRLDVPQGASPQGGEVEAPAFQIATGDGSRVFFTDTQRLTADATAAKGEADLYECKMTVPPAGPLRCSLSDVSAGVRNGGEHAGVQGLVVGMSEDGTRVYFVANGVLAAGATAGEDNLYTAVEDEGSWQVSFIATLSAADEPDWGVNGVVDLSAHTSPSGRWFAFMSDRDLTGYDTRDAETGAPDEEVYLYDAQSAQLSCVSCDPTGARPHGIPDEGLSGPVTPIDQQFIWEGHRLAGLLASWQEVSVNGGVTAYQPQSLSDAGRLFFDSATALMPQASNGAFGVYEFEPVGVGSCVVGAPGYSGAVGGCVALISPGGAQGDAVFLGASVNGDDAFIMSTADGSSSEGGAPLYSIFDVHSCEAGSSWSCASSAGVGSTACETASECKSQTSVLPPGISPASANLEGNGNLRPQSSSKVGKSSGKSKKKGSAARARRLKQALARCRRLHARSVRSRKRCERVARRRYGGRVAAAGDHQPRR